MTTPDISSILLAFKEMNSTDLMSVLKTVTAELASRDRYFSHPDTHPENYAWKWPYQDGNLYFRDVENNIWHVSRNGDRGRWKGRYLPLEDRIDEEADEP